MARGVHEAQTVSVSCVEVDPTLCCSSVNCTGSNLPLKVSSSLDAGIEAKG